MRKVSASILVLLILASCASTPAGRAYQTIGSIKLAVDVGMGVFADRVIDGKATPDQEARVKKAFGEYTATARAAAALMRSTSDTAPPDLAMAAGALLGLLNSFGVETGGK